eukprot:350576-Chlamydomonas_euryale.AAC.11
MPVKAAGRSQVMPHTPHSVDSPLNRDRPAWAAACRLLPRPAHAEATGLSVRFSALLAGWNLQERVLEREVG